MRPAKVASRLGLWVSSSSLSVRTVQLGLPSPPLYPTTRGLKKPLPPTLWPPSHRQCQHPNPGAVRRPFSLPDRVHGKVRPTTGRRLALGDPLSTLVTRQDLRPRRGVLVRGPGAPALVSSTYEEVFSVPPRQGVCHPRKRTLCPGPRDVSLRAGARLPVLGFVQLTSVTRANRPSNLLQT